MMGIGMGELVLVLGVALIVIGPDKFPQFAKLLFRTIRDIRDYTTNIKEEIAKELRPVEDEMRELSRYTPEQVIDAWTEREAVDGASEPSPEPEPPSEATEPGDEGIEREPESSDNGLP